MANAMHLLHAMSYQSDTPQTIGRDTRRRVWGFARPYRSKVVGFLAVVTASSLLGVVPPLLFREIIDGAIMAGDRFREGVSLYDVQWVHMHSIQPSYQAYHQAIRRAIRMCGHRHLDAKQKTPSTLQVRSYISVVQDGNDLHALSEGKLVLRW